VLERAGWTFERIRGSAFYRDPDGALEPLWAHLDELGIPTGDEWLAAEPQATVLTVEGKEFCEPPSEILPKPSVAASSDDQGLDQPKAAASLEGDWDGPGRGRKAIAAAIEQVRRLAPPPGPPRP
jgi:hypothetical protein